MRVIRICLYCVEVQSHRYAELDTFYRPSAKITLYRKKEDKLRNVAFCQWSSFHCRNNGMTCLIFQLGRVACLPCVQVTQNRVENIATGLLSNRLRVQKALGTWRNGLRWSLSSQVPLILSQNAALPLSRKSLSTVWGEPMILISGTKVAVVRDWNM